MDYVIQSGDTLSIIANRFGVTVENILRANPRLERQAFIFPGQIIHIPLQGACPVPMESLYIVQPGDTLTRIAVRFNIPVGALLQANPQITDPNLVYPGQIIAIPLPFGSVNPVRPRCPYSRPWILSRTKVNKDVSNGLPGMKAILIFGHTI